jgi:hypothetical protein
MIDGVGSTEWLPLVPMILGRPALAVGSASVPWQMING